MPRKKYTSRRRARERTPRLLALLALDNPELAAILREPYAPWPPPAGPRVPPEERAPSGTEERS